MVTFVEYSSANQNVFQPAAYVGTTVGVSHSQDASQAPSKSVSLRSIANELNSQASAPLHDQIFFLIKKALDDGQLEDVCEGRLPSLRNMSSMLGVSRETVSKAISKLTGYGYLSAEERKRIYVLPRNGATPLTHADQYRSLVVANGHSDADHGGEARGEQLDFRPPSDDAAPQGTYNKNYLTHKYLKTLRKQSAKRARLDQDSCGLVSFREVLCEQLKRDSGVNCSAENLIIFSDYKSCIDFIVRLTTKGRSTCVMEAPGSLDIASILDLNAMSIVEIPVDVEGMRTDILSSYGVTDSVCFVSPSLHDPLGVRLSAQRSEILTSWATESNSIIVECSSSQGFLRIGSTPSLWRPNAAFQSVFAWTITSALKPWTQTCCAAFSDDLIQEARRLKLTVGGEVAINEQMALQDFILDGDLLRAQRQRELVNLEKRRRLGLAFSRIFKGALSVWRGNSGPRLVFEVSNEANADLVAETAKHCGLPLKVLEEFRLGDLPSSSSRVVVDLDLINLDSLSSKMEHLESILESQ